MTIDVAKLRDEAARHPDSRPDVYGIELSELLDAYEELHQYDADMEQGGDWLPLPLREAVKALPQEQRMVVSDWYWRTTTMIGNLQGPR